MCFLKSFNYIYVIIKLLNYCLSKKVYLFKLFFYVVRTLYIKKMFPILIIWFFLKLHIYKYFSLFFFLAYIQWSQCFNELWEHKATPLFGLLSTLLIAAIERWICLNYSENSAFLEFSWKLCKGWVISIWKFKNKNMSL